jgi:hypothetical protein
VFGKRLSNFSLFGYSFISQSFWSQPLPTIQEAGCRFKLFSSGELFFLEKAITFSIIWLKDFVPTKSNCCKPKPYAKK